MLKIRYERICDACGVQTWAETTHIRGSAPLPAPAPARFGAMPGAWMYELCEECFEPLSKPLREIAQAGEAKKETRK